MLIIVISNSVSELHLTRCLRAAAKQLKKVSFQAPLASGGRARRALVISELLHRFSICAHMNMSRHRVVNAKGRKYQARDATLEWTLKIKIGPKRVTLAVTMRALRARPPEVPQILYLIILLLCSRARSVRKHLVR